MDGLDRRTLLRLAAAGGLAASASPWWLEVARGAQTRPAWSSARLAASEQAHAFFTPAEVAWTDAAVDRLIPADASGPGAVQAGVTVFIDRQLAGRFGRATDWYMGGPWAKGSEQQGYQLQRTPAELYRAAIAAVDAHCRGRFADKTFAALSAADRDQVLHELEDDKLQLAGVSGKAFFDMLWQNTKEGFFADPMYEGNRGFIGWKLIGFPGPRYNYVSEIRHFGEPYRWPTVGVLGRDPTRRLAPT